MSNQSRSFTQLGREPREFSFSQAQGYEEIPSPLKLEELPKEARVQIWNVFFVHLQRSVSRRTRYKFVVDLGWSDILRAVHADYHGSALDEWDPDFRQVCKELRGYVENRPFNKVFDLIQFVLRRRECHTSFSRQMQQKFEECRLAYIIDIAWPPTILPAVTPEEGRSVVDALQTLRQAGLDGGASHLRQASERLNAGDWAGSVRESIHAVESVARQIDPDAAKTLGPALASLEKRGALHPALKEGFGKLYGYTSDEQGVRHALLDQTEANVGIDEAVFMLGACASFASYLWRKREGGERR